MPDEQPEAKPPEPPPDDAKLAAYKDGVRGLNWFVTPVPIFKEEELEAMFEPYPLAKPSEDQRWAIWTVWIWVGFTVFSIAFILWLIVMGFYYGGHR
ncbi:MAG: hypothetical protein FJ291_16295 [Planctomycetes bacterium]|nr:hypothetical protein [Planctomycetota bacterium]